MQDRSFLVSSPQRRFFTVYHPLDSVRSARAIYKVYRLHLDEIESVREIAGRGSKRYEIGHRRTEQEDIASIKTRVAEGRGNRYKNNIWTSGGNEASIVVINQGLNQPRVARVPVPLRGEKKSSVARETNRARSRVTKGYRR